MSTRPIGILVVDDHDIVREALAALFDRAAGMSVVGFAANGEEAVIAAQRLRPHVIIMDLVLPALNGIDATRHILSELPETLIIALSACRTAEQVNRALRAGARGYVLKAAAGAELLQAVHAVTAGHQYLSPAIGGLSFDGALNMSSPPSPFERLSVRERQVLRRIVAGSSSSDIALHLSLSRKTVDTYRSRLMLKLGVANRSALIRFAMDYELPLV